ncbi:intermembrane transport protein PqiB [Serpens gallinarum]|uniref:MCE family protein n=1 Tax=Serpens gallinarum TaxID=2763075 RepID=A0ABR8TN13_9PSED|nr:MlaD family protein [Serpens gallinarum]MBD7977165.1 MCE family protein [Serpens gallinarum]
MQQHSMNPATPEPAPIKTRRWNVSLVWIVPIVALLIGASLVVRNWMQEGPTVTITFKTGEGLVANKTEVRYRNLVIGKVTTIELAEDKRSVKVTASLSKEAESFARADSQFWVVRPRIGAGGVTGLDTLLSGSFIGADAGQSTQRADSFVGLESPPPITYGEEGKSFFLSAPELGSLDIGSPIYYRKIQVGQVISYALDADGKGVTIGVFIRAPNDAYVTADSRFWNASGIDVSVDAKGIRVDTASLASVLAGGLAFGSPEFVSSEQAAARGHRFTLFANQESALAPPTGAARYIRLRFDQSLRGLAVDAPVEFMGVEFGKVIAVQLDFDEQKQSFPLIVDAVIYPNRLGPAYTKMIEALKHSPGDELAAAQLIESFVKHGLRAQARSGNLLTGQLYISLDFYPDEPPVAFNPAERPILVPTVPGNLERVQERLQQLVDRVSQLPLERMVSNLDANLNELRQGLRYFNRETLPGIQKTLEELQGTLESANLALADDSPQRQQIGQTLNELRRMSRSLRELTDYLGRHPESLIRGRSNSSER